MILVSSWDDGHPLDARVAEMHRARGLTATFYVPLRNREGRDVMSREQIRALDVAGFEIGSHTAGHQRLDTLNRTDASREIRVGKEGLEQVLGHAVPGFCYPGGRRPGSARALLREAGITHARTIENLRTDRNFAWDLIPTTLQFYPHRWPVLLRNAGRSPLRVRRKLTLLAQVARHGDGLDALTHLIENCAATDSVFHLWGHSWEVERLGAWRILEKVLTAAAACCNESMTVGQLWDSIVRNRSP
jgi:peptidoglycan/xylan/chitin deacetylase (PgdA/CDA1 family)